MILKHCEKVLDVFFDKVRAWMVLLVAEVVFFFFFDNPWGYFNYSVEAYLIKVTNFTLAWGFLVSLFLKKELGWRVYIGEYVLLRMRERYYSMVPRRRVYIFNRFFRKYLVDLLAYRLLTGWLFACVVLGPLSFAVVGFEVEAGVIFAPFVLLLPFVYTFNKITHIVADKWRRRYDEYIGRIAESARDTVIKCRARRGEGPPPKREQKYYYFDVRF